VHPSVRAGALQSVARHGSDTQRAEVAEAARAGETGTIRRAAKLALDLAELDRRRVEQPNRR